MTDFANNLKYPGKKEQIKMIPVKAFIYTKTKNVYIFLIRIMKPMQMRLM